MMARPKKEQVILSADEIVRRCKEHTLSDAKIEKIINDAIILCNRSEYFYKRFDNKIDAIIKPLVKALKVLDNLSLKYNAIEVKNNAMQSLGVIIHDLMGIRKRIKSRDYLPHLIAISEDGKIGYQDTKKNDDTTSIAYKYKNDSRIQAITDNGCDYSKDYANIYNECDVLFTKNDVLKLASVCIVGELKKRQGMSGDKSTDARGIIKYCFSEDVEDEEIEYQDQKRKQLRKFSICAIQDDDNNICLSAPNSYTDKTNFNDSKIIYIKDNTIEAIPFN
jgi:hypothetical protein